MSSRDGSWQPMICSVVLTTPSKAFLFATEQPEQHIGKQYVKRNSTAVYQKHMSSLLSMLLFLSGVSDVPSSPLHE